MHVYKEKDRVFIFPSFCKGFLPPNALQASGRATRYWSGRPWSRGWFRKLFFLGWGEPKHCPGKQRCHPEKTHQWDSKKMFLFQNPKEIRSELGFRESSIQAQLFLVVAMTDRISHQNWLHPKLFINHFHLFLVYTVYLHEGFHFWSFITCSLRCWNPFKSPCPWHGTCPISQRSWSPSLFCRTGESSCACRFFGSWAFRGEHRRPRLWMSIRSFLTSWN